jgi:hypothetical protein
MDLSFSHNKGTSSSLVYRLLASVTREVFRAKAGFDSQAKNLFLSRILPRGSHRRSCTSQVIIKVLEASGVLGSRPDFVKIHCITAQALRLYLILEEAYSYANRALRKYQNSIPHLCFPNRLRLSCLCIPLTFRRMGYRL